MSYNCEKLNLPACWQEVFPSHTIHCRIAELALEEAGNQGEQEKIFTSTENPETTELL